MADDKEQDQVEVLRKEVLRDLHEDDDKSAGVAASYKKLFTHVGSIGLPKLVEDEDASIAMQAAWELHRKSVKRDPPIKYRTDWAFDKKSLGEFLKVMTKRLKSEPPAWWSATLLNGDVFPGRHHSFMAEDLPPAATLKAEKEHVVVTVGKQSLRLSKADLPGSRDLLEGAPAVLCEAEVTFIARPMHRGYPFEVIGVDSKAGEKLWSSTVWAARRGFSTGPTRRGETAPPSSPELPAQTQSAMS